MTPEPENKRLPFEPSKKRQKTAKTKKAPVVKGKEVETKNKQEPQVTREQMAVPKVVSDRMARRMAAFCGVPTALGMTTFIVSYLIVSNGWFKLPTVAVLLVSTGFFGLGVLGLSYGVISASWDEETVGSLLGWQEFTSNWGRMLSAWRSRRQKKSSEI
ncbi:PAM68 family protein [Gloeocapsopsis crepidinum LEGE 06123]|uniref:PAM68 family protein n=1 Tax=Gloeocapsopsis crepidinum LEGE 06123 TaxID=588587 RepID=A0ABR9UVA3_9CHRO|nr:PAM68 family protein [Gloeocapsopsis crepidinum]MBE9192199.1 PAM68 family protein [Gloeocapsopsis crepidinum LEGE 06123]